MPYLQGEQDFPLIPTHTHSYPLVLHTIMQWCYSSARETLDLTPRRLCQDHPHQRVSRLHARDKLCELAACVLQKWTRLTPFQVRDHSRRNHHVPSPHEGYSCGARERSEEDRRGGGQARWVRSIRLLVLYSLLPPTNESAGREEGLSSTWIWADRVGSVLSRRRGSEGYRHPVLAGDAARLRGAREVRRRRPDCGCQQVKRRYRN